MVLDMGFKPQPSATASQCLAKMFGLDGQAGAEKRSD
jgi:hypothetical protein